MFKTPTDQSGTRTSNVYISLYLYGLNFFWIAGQKRKETETVKKQQKKQGLTQTAYTPFTNL